MVLLLQRILALVLVLARRQQFRFSAGCGFCGREGLAWGRLGWALVGCVA